MSFILPRELTEAVTGWFSENGRDLPWRREPDPYRVWLSEIMLQQTRIEAVIPYYFRFLEAFPSVSSLAEAEDGRLYKLWEGLGYYSRARNLKKAAIILARDYGGALPPDPKLLRSLPGIGDYTAGAVASIAFGLPEPAVDGNVLRVLSRVSLYGGDVMLPAAKKEAAEALREIYPGGRAAAMMTEGLMEIGEVVCVPNGEPLCASCPLRGLCQAEARGEALNYPVRSPRKERRIEERTVFLIRAPGGRFLLRRRPAEGLLGGMWEFPSVPGSCAEVELRPRNGPARSSSPILCVRRRGEAPLHPRGVADEGDPRGTGGDAPSSPRGRRLRSRRGTGVRRPGGDRRKIRRPLRLPGLEEDRAGDRLTRIPRKKKKSRFSGKRIGIYFL